MFGLGMLVLCLIGLVGLCVYFLPTIVASHRRHPSSIGIFILNLFLGWSVLGWVVSLVWAASGPRGDVPRYAGFNNQLTKRCPACAEEILAAARKCKHCGELQPDSFVGPT
jgi:hypothetical protein